MTYDVIRKHLACCLNSSQIKIDITGFDMDAFSQAVHHDLKDRLDSIESIVFQDEDIMPDDEKIESIKELFRYNI